MVKIDCSNSIKTLSLFPNRSLEWTDILPWLALICIPSATIGFGWLIFGVWTILPFAGIEIALLSYVMYRICYINHTRQNIIISDTGINVSTGIRKPMVEHKLAREGCRQIIRNTPSNTIKLFLVHQRTEIELGAFLTDKEKRIVSESLTASYVPKYTEAQTVLTT